jgi:hypothetical protein
MHLLFPELLRRRPRARFRLKTPDGGPDLDAAEVWFVLPMPTVGHRERRRARGTIQALFELLLHKERVFQKTPPRGLPMLTAFPQRQK